MLQQDVNYVIIWSMTSSADLWPEPTFIPAENHWGCIDQTEKDRMESPWPHGGLESVSSGTQRHPIPKLLPTSTGTSKKAGAAAEQAAILKADKYRELTSKYFFIPVAIETLGPINVDGANFLSKLGRRIEQSSMEKLETAHIFERISIAVQRGNAASFAGCFEELEPLRQWFRRKTNWQYRTD